MPQLKRTLTRNATIAIVVGGIIGSGIFMKPALMAAQLQSPMLLLSVWVVAGVITLFGALSNAEVAAMFPETGGQYVFFQKMYGKGFAFLYAWSAFAVFNTAGNASVAYVFSQYANYFIALPRLSPMMEQSFQLHLPFIGTFYPLQMMGVKLLTVAIILILTYVNQRSVKGSSVLQQLLTLLKAIAIVLLIGGLLGTGNGSFEHLTAAATSSTTGWSLLSAYMAAIAGAFWAYDGWNNITFVAGEVQHPQKNIPFGLFTGVFFCMLVYLLMNLAFLYVLPVQQMAASAFVATDAAKIAWGPIGASIIALMIMLFVLGACNANIMATARVTHAMGNDNRLFARMSAIHPIHQTPAKALWLNAIVAVLFIVSGSFDMLTDMLIFVSWFFYGMSALGVFILRRKMPQAKRAYKVWGYPIVTAIFVLFTLFFLLATLYTDITNYQNGTTPVINSLFGALITGLGIPIYRLFRIKKDSPTTK